MRSYYAHLQQVKDSQSIAKTKPIFRASAIFPAMHSKQIATRLIFLSYWLLKRRISKITSLLTLRAKEGQVLYRGMTAIDQPRAYRIELASLLIGSGFDLDQDFIGSLEIEFFSALPLAYPYPAVTVNYYGRYCSTVVHTAQRIYNDYEDMWVNTQQRVPESGFNMRVDASTEPFIALINGPVEQQDTSLDFQFINAENALLTRQLLFDRLAAYETRMIYPAREFIDLAPFLNERAGTLKLTFDIPWIFPRLIVGNMQKSLTHLSITHSYYDCSCSQEGSDYWIPPEEGWYPAALSLPLPMRDDAFAKIYFYPIYAPSNFTLDLHIYDAEGKLVAEKSSILQVEADAGRYICLSINDLLKEAGLAQKRDLSAHILAKTDSTHRIPARIKIALDIGHTKGLPCNICTNLVPYNPDWKDKPTTFHWLPVLADQPRSAVWIVNTSLKLAYTEKAEAILSFYRESDTRKIERQVLIPANGFLVIRPEDDAELSQFLQHTIGWVTVVISNPYATTYYFAENPSGTIGGDHGY